MATRRYGHGSTGRHAFLCFFAVICASATLDALAASVLMSNASARYGSGNTTHAEDGVSGFPLPDDGTSGLQQVQNSHLYLAAEGTANLSGNAIGAAAGWIGASVIDYPPNGGTAWMLFAGTFTRYWDMILVDSSTLAVGTPVQLQFSLHVASSVIATHSFFPGSNTNHTQAHGFIDSAIRFQSNDPDFFLNENSNLKLIDTRTSVADSELGLINPATPHLDIFIDAAVGDNLFFAAEATVRTSGGLAPRTVSVSPLVLDNQEGFTYAAIGLAFGASSLTPGVTLRSERLGGNSFPDAALADGVTAALGMPAVPVPIPGVTPIVYVVVGVLGVLARRRVQHSTAGVT